MIALPESLSVGRLIGYYLTLASPTPFVCILGLISSNVAGYTKKTTVAALYLIGYCVGNIIGMSTTPCLLAIARANASVQGHRHSAPSMRPSTRRPRQLSWHASLPASSICTSSGGGIIDRTQRRPSSELSRAIRGSKTRSMSLLALPIHAVRPTDLTIGGLTSRTWRTQSLLTQCECLTYCIS